MNIKPFVIFSYLTNWYKRTWLQGIGPAELTSYLGVLREDAVRPATHVDGVASASPILYTTSVIETGQADVLLYIIGFDPTEPLGGPQTVVAGTPVL